MNRKILYGYQISDAHADAAFEERFAAGGGANKQQKFDCFQRI